MFILLLSAPIRCSTLTADSSWFNQFIYYLFMFLAPKSEQEKKTVEVSLHMLFIMPAVNMRIHDTYLSIRTKRREKNQSNFNELNELWSKTTKEGERTKFVIQMICESWPDSTWISFCYFENFQKKSRISHSFQHHTWINVQWISTKILSNENYERNLQQRTDKLKISNLAPTTAVNWVRVSFNSIRYFWTFGWNVEYDIVRILRAFVHASAWHSYFIHSNLIFWHWPLNAARRNAVIAIRFHFWIFDDCLWTEIHIYLFFFSRKKYDFVLESSWKYICNVCGTNRHTFIIRFQHSHNYYF